MVATAFLGTYGTVFLPIILLAALGFRAMKQGMTKKKDALELLSDLVVDYLLPVVGFAAMLKADLSTGSVGWFFTFPWIMGGIEAGVVWCLMRRNDFEKVAPGFVLATLGKNCGNYGMPAIGLAFGSDALAGAAIYYVSWCFFLHTAAMALATSVTRDAEVSSWRQKLRKVARMPLIYGSLAGLLLNCAGLKLEFHSAFYKFLELVSTGTPMLMLIILGMQIARQPIRIGANRMPLGAVLAMRLLVGPAVAFVIASFLGLDATTRNALTLASGMPTALQSLSLALKLRVGEFVSDAIVASTAVSLFTLPVLIVALLYFF